MSNGESGERAPKQMARDLLDGAEPALAQGGEFEELKRELAALAERGDAEAQTLLGAILLEIVRDPTAARKWFELSAAAGDGAGQRSLGFLYANGLGVRRSEEKAVALFRAAAEAGDGFAMFNLAATNMAKDGKYLSYAETVDLLERAEGAGIVEATAKLGDLLAAGDRDEEALACYVRAASQGHVGAMNAAACWHRDGTAGPRDLVQSARWFLTMLRYGNGDGVHEAGMIAGDMTDEEIREAARLAGDVAMGEAIIFTRNG